MLKAFVSATLILGAAAVAQAEVQCRTWSNGYTFREIRSNRSDARRAVIRECDSNPRTNYGECSANVDCSTFGGGSYDPNPPSVRGDLCYVRQTDQWVDGERFFSLASEYANRHNTCVVAKIHSVSNSGRIYNEYGERVEKYRGGMSNSEVDDALSRNGLWDCERFSCTQYNY